MTDSWTKNITYWAVEWCHGTEHLHMCNVPVLHTATVYELQKQRSNRLQGTHYRHADSDKICSS